MQAVNEVLTRDEVQMVRIMQLLGDKTRYKMLKIMLNERNMCVSDIASRLDISVSAVSQHFRNFELAGLVDKRRDGQRICYSLNDSNELMHSVTKLIQN